MRGKDGIGIIRIVEEIEDNNGKDFEESMGLDPARKRERFEHAIRGLEKPKPPPRNPKFKNITIEERSERLLLIELLAQEYLSPEQIYDLLPAMGMSVPLSRVYTYLSMVRLPKLYRKQVEKRSRRVHDALAVHHMIRLARDGKELGLTMERIQVARKLPGYGMIPDVQFFFGPYGYFIEEQVAPLTFTRWRARLRTHLKRRLETRDNIRELFIVNDRADMTRAKGYARELQKEHRREDVKLFLFTEQLTMKGSMNTVGSRVWETPWGHKIALTDWMSGIPKRM